MRVPEGRWVLSDLEGGEPVSGSEITLAITREEFAGNAGVNRYFGKIEGDFIGSPIGSTMMAGPPELMEQERTFLDMLDKADRWVVTDGRLIVKAGPRDVATFDPCWTS